MIIQTSRADRRLLEMSLAWDSSLKGLCSLYLQGRLLPVACLLILLLSGCGSRSPVVSTAGPVVIKGGTLAPMGYTIQVGAFSNVENAIKLTETLQGRDLRAYYFIHKTELYKVRFGNFPTREIARSRAEALRAKRIIDEYYIVSPNDYAAARWRKYGGRYLRDEIVETAQTFIGVPYRWGGSSLIHGFDCSGLTMAVYQLNGLDLPRSSKEQWKAGTLINRSQISKGDLVFFAMSGGKAVSHVGIYVGGDRFIHAPGRGKKIRSDLLDNSYYKRRFVGARAYL